jgi:hypothetical protein
MMNALVEAISSDESPSIASVCRKLDIGLAEVTNTAVARPTSGLPFNQKSKKKERVSRPAPFTTVPASADRFCFPATPDRSGHPLLESTCHVMRSGLLLIWLRGQDLNL